MEHVGWLSVVYIIIGYFLVRYIHQYEESLPNLFMGLFAVVLWPVVAAMYGFIIIFTTKKNIYVDKIFGKGK